MKENDIKKAWGNVKEAWANCKTAMNKKTALTGPVWLIDYVIPFLVGGGLAALGMEIASLIFGIRYAPYSIQGIKSE